MKIGIMGGTFDPIHNGHLMLAKEAYQQYQLSEIWFMPNGNPPHKTMNIVEATAIQRAEMVRMSISDFPFCRIEEYELNNNEGPSYSYKTMESLCDIHPEDEFYFIIGADSLFAIETWKKPERLLRKCVVLVACRDENNTYTALQKQIDYLEERYSAQIKILKTDIMPIASHEIRKAIKKHEKNAFEVLPKEVACYIKTNHLYEEKNL